jgi:hypothetical protein
MNRHLRSVSKTKTPGIPWIQTRGIRGAFLASLFALAGLSGCSTPRTADRASSTSIGEENNILQERSAKDVAFKTESSPIPPKDRSGFHGLSYFPVDPQLRFLVRLQRYPAPSRVRLGTNTGEIRSGIRYGYFEFKVGDQACRLQVYRLEDAPEDGGSMLFIPFRDSTSGRESYGAGRYVDLKENTSGVYDLDFNRAYNPSCAYNNEYSCPVPPAENTLNVPIRAGEKKYH